MGEKQMQNNQIIMSQSEQKIISLYNHPCPLTHFTRIYMLLGSPHRVGLEAAVMTEQILNDTQDQSNVLSSKSTVIIFVGLALTLFISVLDQTSVSTSLPIIGKELDAVSTISWVQTYRTHIIRF